MKSTQIAAVFFAALIASAGVSALAADTQGTPDKPGMMSQDNTGGGMMQGRTMPGPTAQDDATSCGTMDGRVMQHGGMMRGGMMNGMMQNGMMGRGMMSGHTMVPQLPAGNEKLQLKMQAEIMQKVGEIIAKYADQVVINKGAAQ